MFIIILYILLLIHHLYLQKTYNMQTIDKNNNDSKFSDCSCIKKISADRNTTKIKKSTNITYKKKHNTLFADDEIDFIINETKFDKILITNVLDSYYSRISNTSILPNPEYHCIFISLSLKIPFNIVTAIFDSQHNFLISVGFADIV